MGVQRQRRGVGALDRSRYRRRSPRKVAEKEIDKFRERGILAAQRISDAGNTGEANRGFAFGLGPVSLAIAIGRIHCRGVRNLARCPAGA